MNLKKNISILCFLTFFSCSAIYKTNISSASKITSNVNYEVIKIKEYEKGYIIYAQRNDSVFRILSFKGEHKQDSCNIIALHKHYEFNLKSCFEGSIVPRNHLGGKHLGNDIIPIEELGTVRDIFYDERLGNLCLAKM